MPDDLDRLCHSLARRRPPRRSAGQHRQPADDAAVEIRSEPELIALARTLAGDDAAYSDAEAELFVDAERPSPHLVAWTRARIAAGADPLGEAFCGIRSAKRRRTSGAVYTPTAIVDSMLDWAARAGVPARIVDPGAGSGRFILAAGRRFPAAALVGIDTDPLATLMLRANAAVLDLADRLVVRLEDFRDSELPRARGATLFIGNPPYVRHHHIAERWKQWFKETAARHGVTASQLAGLHIHFFLKARDLARPGDFGAFVTSAEWLDVNYGALLRKMLADGLGGTAVQVLTPTAMPFGNTATTGAIACFRVGSQHDRVTFRSVEAVDQLGDLTVGRRIQRSRLAETRRWSSFLGPASPPPRDCISLGEVFRVHRGQVTGANAVWIAGNYRGDLPDRVLFPTVTKARELIAAGDGLASTAGLRRVIDIPPDLDRLPESEREQVDRFLSWARGCGADQSYVARHRDPWWSVSLREPAPILCTYMARRPPAFVRNSCGARHLNIAHGLYPRLALSSLDIAALLRYLSNSVSRDMGRTYAGGLTKFEPGEVERIPIPRLDKLHELAAEMVATRTPAGRARGDGDLPTRAT